MKTSELNGAALDWAVAKCEGFNLDIHSGMTLTIRKDGDWWNPTVDWSQGGPIIERWVSDLSQRGEWYAQIQINDVPEYAEASGPTPLIAAMRCYVASKLGDDIELPKGLQ